MAVTDAIKLRIYNGALRMLGSRKIASLGETREPRRILDDVWGGSDECVHLALEAGEWNFAIRTVQADYSPSVEPDFGFKRAYDKPDDFRRLITISANEFFTQPLTAREFSDEAGYWFSEYDTIYIRYISDDDDYGLNSGAWAESFKKYLEAYLAFEACERITNSTTKVQMAARAMSDALKTAKSRDAMNEGTKFPTVGNWARSRSGFSRYRGEQ